MNVTMQIDRNSFSVYIADTGHSYSTAELNRIIRQITVSRNWLRAEQAKRKQSVQEVEAK